MQQLAARRQTSLQWAGTKATCVCVQNDGVTLWCKQLQRSTEPDIRDNMKRPLTDQELSACAYRIRRFALQMGEIQGQGYVGQALGYADVLAVAYCHAMNFKSDNPEWSERDRFLLSHGHYAIAHYAALIEAGIISEQEMETYGCDDSRLPMSGMAAYTPGMEVSGGIAGTGVGHWRGYRPRFAPSEYQCICLQLHV